MNIYYYTDELFPFLHTLLSGEAINWIRIENEVMSSAEEKQVI